MTSEDLYNSNPKIFKQLTINDNLFVHYNCPQRDKILKLYSDHNQFLFTINGKKIFRHGDDMFYATKDSTFLLKRSAFLQELPDDYNGFEVLVFYLKDNYLKKVFEEYRSYLPLQNLPESSENMFIQFEVNEQMFSVYQSLINLINQKTIIPESILEAKFKELMFNILAHPSNRQVLSYIKNVADQSKIPIYEIMESNYMHDLKTAAYANLSGRSLASFKREFVAYYHTSPGKWLKERRLKRAKILMETSNKTIAEIAFESGFINTSHFSKVFKTKFGVSPSKFRHN